MVDKFVSVSNQGEVRRHAEIRRGEFATPVVLSEVAGPGFGLFYSTDNELMVAVRTNVFRLESTGAFETAAWTASHAGSGSATHAAGELVVAPGITANSAAIIESVQKGRQMSGTTQFYINVVRLSDLGVTNNKRRWGLFDANNGFFFQLDGTTFSVVTRKATVDTVVPYAAWNGPATETFNPAADLMNMSQYGLFFGGMSLRFHINGRVAHAFGANTLTTPLTEVLSLPFRYESVNSGGATTDAKIFGRGTSFHRVSPAEITPRYVHISTAATTVVRSGSGTLRRVVINNPSAAGTVTIYDNTAGSGPVIATINIAASTNSAFGLDFGLEVNTGITVVTSVATDLTVTFD